MNQPELSDVLVRCGDKQYRAHRLILSAWSPVFEERLSKAASTQTFILDVDQDITTSSISSSTIDVDSGFLQFLNFLYSGKTDLTESTVKVVLGLALEYKIQPLQEMCEQFIGKEVGQHSVEKALEWLEEAEKKGLVLLQENCMKVLRAYFQFIPAASWQKLRLDQLISIIESSEVVVEDEYAVFSKVVMKLLTKLFIILSNKPKGKLTREINTLFRVNTDKLTRAGFEPAAEGDHHRARWLSW